MKGITNQPEVNQMTIFQNEEFGQVRTVTIDGEPMFCLADICKALELSQPSKVKERLNQKGVNSIPTLTSGGTQNLLYVNESNLYKTIFQSRKESAERFTDWVTSEVLPSIRKHGAYISEEVMNQLVLLQKAVTDITERLVERFKYTDERIDDITRRLEALEASRKEPFTSDKITETTSDMDCSSYDEWIKDNHLTKEKISAHPTTVVYESYVKYYSGNKLVGVGKKTFYKKLQKDFGFTKRKQKSDGKRYFI